jgi:serine/threonine-protein kinase
VSQAEYCPHDGSLLVSDDEVPDPMLGRVVLEQFRIEQQIGTGGMGTVYRAHQTTVGRDVAIKVLRPELARDEQSVSRFEREGRLAISLDHPNLVRVFLTGRFDDGRLYIVMELLEGRTLADELEQIGPPALDRAVIILMKLCAALGAVHAAGVVHRDIKPQNVYLVRRGKDLDFVKLVDFGIARVLQAENADSTTTQNGRIFGTATYISPEAATGDRSDHRSDIYSLGVLAYELLTGQVPFEGSTTGAVLMQHVHRRPPPMREKGRGAEVPDSLEAVVMRSLEKDPDARQQTLAEFLDSLVEGAGRAGLLNDARALLLATVWGDELAAPGSHLADLLASSSPPGAPAALADTGPVSFSRDPEEEALLRSAPAPFGTTSHDLVAVSDLEKKEHPRAWTLLGLVALVVLGVAAGAWWRLGGSQSDVQAPSPLQPSVALGEEPPTVMEDLDQPEPDAATHEPSTQANASVVETEAPEQTVEKAPPPLPPVKAKKKRPSAPRNKKRRTRASAPTSASAPAKATEVEPDEGIDWTVPDFPAEPPPKTAVTPPTNPIVIDEPPPR